MIHIYHLIIIIFLSFIFFYFFKKKDPNPNLSISTWRTSIVQQCYLTPYVRISHVGFNRTNDSVWTLDFGHVCPFRTLAAAVSRKKLHKSCGGGA
jgi:hypothetical protein